MASQATATLPAAQAPQAHHGCWAPVTTAPRAATSATPPSSVSRGPETSTAVAACQVRGMEPGAACSWHGALHAMLLLSAGPSRTLETCTSPCRIPWARAGRADCNQSPADGCEASLSALLSCGRCGNACPDRRPGLGQACTAGTCTCKTGTRPSPASAAAPASLARIDRLAS